MRVTAVKLKSNIEIILAGGALSYVVDPRVAREAGKMLRSMGLKVAKTRRTIKPATHEVVKDEDGISMFPVQKKRGGQ